MDKTIPLVEKNYEQSISFVRTNHKPTVKNGSRNIDETNHLKRKFHDSIRGLRSPELTESRRTCVGAAALLIQDAMNNTDNANPSGKDDEFFNPYEAKGKFFLLSRRILYNPLFEMLLHISLYTLVALTFIEPPQWCDLPDGIYSNEDCFEMLNLMGTPAFGDEVEEGEGVYYYPSS